MVVHQVFPVRADLFEAPLPAEDELAVTPRVGATLRDAGVEPNRRVDHITVLLPSGRAEKIEIRSRDRVENLMNRAAMQMMGSGAPANSRLLHEGYTLDPLARITEFDEDKVLTLVLSSESKVPDA